MKYRTLSPMQKIQIVGMRKAGMKCKDIAKVFSAPCSTISTILSHWKVHGNVESLKSQCGRSRKLSERDIRVLCHVVSSNRRHILVELTNLVSVSRTTVRFYLRELDFRNCIAPKKSYLNVKHKADRLAFARYRVEKSLLWEITGSLAAADNDLRIGIQLLFSKSKIIIKQIVFNRAHTKDPRPNSSIQR